MANKISYTARGVEVIAFDTGLNSLANDGNKLGIAIDNSVNRDLYIDIEVDLASVDLSAQTNPAVNIYLLTSSDDTNYDDGSDSVDPTVGHLVAVVAVGATSAAHRNTARMIGLPPGFFKLLVENKTGVPFAASGNIVTYRVYSVEMV